jgi:hypothetical protein
MKQFRQVLGFLVVLFIFTTPEKVYANNTFTCTLQGSCKTTQVTCLQNYIAAFNDDNGLPTRHCEDLAYNNCIAGPHDCKFSCTPNQKLCNNNGVYTCDARGTGVTGYPDTDCSATGRVCTQDASGARCITCLENCLAQGSTPGECNAVCNIQQPPPPSPSPPPAGQPPSSPPGQTGDAPVVNLNQLIDSIGFKTFKSTSTLGDIINVAIPILFALAGTGLLLYLISGGFGYLTSAGDPKKMEAAKTVITNAVIGFLIIISAYFITQAVSFIFNLGGGF